MISHRSLLYFFVEHGRKSVAQNHQTQICCSFCNFSFKFSFSSGAISSIFACDPLHTQSKTTSQMCPKLSKCVRTHPLTVPGQPRSSFSFISLSKLGMERCKGNSKASPASKWISSCISKKRDRRERNCFFLLHLIPTAACVLTCYPAFHLTFYIANILPFYPKYVLMLYVTCIMMYYVHFGIPSGILSDRYSGILSGVSSGTGLLPDIYSEKICDMSTEIYSDNF